ncbi:MAG: flagellar biosynthesis protein FlhB, partial [Candidatus Muiribacteriota bacterium]
MIKESFEKLNRGLCSKNLPPVNLDSLTPRYSRINNFFEIDYINSYKTDLQFFAEDSPTGQKTEDATPRRREKERERGNVLKSMEVNNVAIILSGFLSIMFLGRHLMENIARFTNLTFRNLSFDIADFNQLKVLYSQSLMALLSSAGIIIGCVFLAGLIANLLQVGLLFTLEPFKLEMNKFNPVSGMKKIFSVKNIVEMLKALGKIIVISYFPIRTISKHFINLLNTIKMNMYNGFAVIIEIISIIIWQIIAALIVIAIIDYFYQKYEYEKNIKMSKYDVKKEREDMDGKPEIKRAQRKKMMDILRKNMFNELPKADVVITNPVHYAIAIKYDTGSDSPPYVVAKGAFKLALKIKEVAKEHDIPIIENKPLARSLYKEVGLGESIPEEFFKAVAEILAWAFKIKGK